MAGQEVLGLNPSHLPRTGITSAHHYAQLTYMGSGDPT